mgnify:CR=1 FL=1
MSFLTEEDQEAIELLLISHYNEQVTAWENNFLESIQDRQHLSKKQRDVFESICVRILK